jgi:hypothetical protein
MAFINISVINASTVLSDADVQKVVPALQTQVHRDFAPAWGIDADLTFVPHGKRPAANTWWLVVLDNSDQAGALGYHDITRQGLPLGKVFAKSDMQYGLQWSVTASHELLEMLADPDINLTAFVQKDLQHGRLFAYEVCDAVEADELGYQIDGVQVSDFVFPSWFESFRKKDATQFDYCNLVKEPFQLLKGGYIGVYDVNGGGGWVQLTADLSPQVYAARPKVGTRRERRRTPRDQWLKSTVE